RDSRGTLVIPLLHDLARLAPCRLPHLLMSRTTLTFLFAAALAPAVAHAQDNPLSSCKLSTMVKAGMDNSIVPGTDVHEWIFKGSVQIICDDITLFADEVH